MDNFCFLQKGQIVTILGFPGHPESITTEQSSGCSIKTDIDNR